MTAKALRTTIEKCDTCGKLFERVVGRRRHQCVNCKLANVYTVNDQQRSKSGPEYEKVVRRQLAHWRAEAQRLELEG